MSDSERHACPACADHPEMVCVGRSSQPIMVTTYVKGRVRPLVSGGSGKIYRTESFYCEIFRCKECSHIEWKAVT